MLSFVRIVRRCRLTGVLVAIKVFAIKFVVIKVFAMKVVVKARLNTQHRKR